MKSTAPARSHASEKTAAPSDGERGHAWRTILFNDEVHTFQEVARQLMKAVRCTYDRGLALANVVHHTGSAIVYQGHRERCEAVAMVLEDIKLRTQVSR